jgi:hypothetical protein
VVITVLIGLILSFLLFHRSTFERPRIAGQVDACRQKSDVRLS